MWFFSFRMLTLGIFFGILGCKETRQIVIDEEDAIPRQASSSRTLDLGFEPLSSAGLLVAAICQDSLLAAELDSLNWNLVCVPLHKASEVETGVQEGWLDAGVASTESVIHSCSLGTVRVLSIMDQSYSTLLTQTPIPMYQIRGKRIGFISGSPAAQFFRDYLKSVGLEESSVQMIPTTARKLPRLLSQKAIDAMAVDEPFTSLFLFENQDWQFSMRKMGRHYLFAHRVLMENPEPVLALLRSQIRQQLWLGEAGNRLHADTWRWKSALEFGFSQPSPKALKELANKTNNTGISTSSSLDFGPSFLPSSGDCPDTVSYHSALDKFLLGNHL
jgi:hypothetical protein